MTKQDIKFLFYFVAFMVLIGLAGTSDIAHLI